MRLEIANVLFGPSDALRSPVSLSARSSHRTCPRLLIRIAQLDNHRRESAILIQINLSTTCSKIPSYRNSDAKIHTSAGCSPARRGFNQHFETTRFSAGRRSHDGFKSVGWGSRVTSQANSLPSDNARLAPAMVFDPRFLEWEGRTQCQSRLLVLAT